MSVRINRFVYIVLFLVFVSLGSLVFFSDNDSQAAKKKADTDGVMLSYDGETIYYTGVRGSLNYNHQSISLSTVPIIKIDSVLYAPARELLETVFGFEWSVDLASDTYRAYDADVDSIVNFRVGEYSFSVTRKGTESVYTTKVPIRSIGYDGREGVPCIPITKLLDGLGYMASWNSGTAVYTIQKTDFFEWAVGQPAADGTINHIYRASGSYEITDNMAYLNLFFNGDAQPSFDSVTVDRDSTLITIKIPTSTYLPNKTIYDRFGEIVKNITISESDGAVLVTIECFDITEFTYTQSDMQLHLRLLYDYSDQTDTTGYSLSILRPDGCFIDQVSNKDLYDSVKYTKAFKIIIQGDHKQFFEDYPVIINSDVVKKITIKINSAGNTVIRVATTSLQGYRIMRQGAYFVVKMGTPREIYKNIIVLDAGHGDFDKGASHYGYNEKALNLKMIYTLMKSFFNQNDPEIKVYWTRRDDSFVTLDARSKFAAKVGADAFVSLHMNSSTNSAANGTEVYYSTDNNKKGFGGIKSSDMAEMMQDALIENLGMDSRGVKTAGFYVIKNNSVPAILIELGFLSGSTDHAKLTKASFQKNATKVMSDVIKSYFSEYPTGR